MTAKQTILVTGGAGFLGSHLCDRLLEAGHRVLCLDNLSTGSRDNIAHITGAPGGRAANFEFIEHDIIDPIRLEVDRIYNLACPASPVQYQSNWRSECGPSCAFCMCPVNQPARCKCPARS